MNRLALLILSTVILPGCASLAPREDSASLQQQVMAAERAFARTMATRDHEAFSAFLAEEAVFFSGERAVRGRDAVAAEWKPFYDAPAAPFSWEPDHVEVLESGTLALSTGPVKDPSGRVVGRFNSIWRRDAAGAWKVVFDKGSPVCTRPPA